MTTPSATTYSSITMPSAFKGSAADNSGGSGLTANTVTYTLQRDSDDYYWNGTDWQSGAGVLASTHGATTGGTSTSWTSSASMPSWFDQASGNYVVQATSVDKAGNSYSGAAVTFTHTKASIASRATGTYTRSFAGGKVIYTFTGAGSVVPSATLSVDYLVVGGGGGGGGAGSGGTRYGGGGGAGGLKTGTTSVGSAQSIAVGSAGIAGSPTAKNANGNGGTSSFGSVSVSGGGAGGIGLDTANTLVGSGNGGGSGGGAGRQTGTGSGTGGAGISGEGNNGVAVNSNWGGGGGGKGATGSSQNGGTGYQSSIDGTARWYAGGGGGAGSSAGTGGSVVGGAGGTTTGNAATYYGGGGGGANGNGVGYNGGNGYQGVVIISYAVPTYTVNATAGSGGSISPSGDSTFNWGDSRTYTITPDDHYQVADVVVDGSTHLGAVTEYTFSDISANPRFP